MSIDGCNPEDTATPAWSSAGTDALAPALGCGLILRSRYVLEEVIGRGGTSIVFRARDLHRVSTEDTTAGSVAVKLLRSEWRADPLAVERLKREFRQMQGLSHPGIVRVFDLDCDDDVWFMTMELVAGTTVKSWMQAACERAEALRVIGACCDALECAHSTGLLHGDLKPTNVLLADDGAVKLIDFGSAPSPGSRLAAPSNAMPSATPLYASPQILAGKNGEIRDDIFSLACLAYGILSAGRHPFGRRPSLEDGRAKSAPTHVSAIPAGLFAVIERGLSAEREQRQASAREFLRDLLAAGHHQQPDARRAEIMALASSDIVRIPGARIRSAWPLASVAALAFAIVGSAVLIRPDAHRQAPASIGSPAVAQAATVPQPALAPQVAAAPSGPEVESASHDSGIISFEAATVHASAAQPVVAVSVRRLRGTRSSGAFVWRVEGGTAYPGVDYQRLPPQLVRFVEGQTVRTLFIPLINTRATLPLYRARSFTVALQPVAGGPALGRLDRVTVTIDPPASAEHLAVYQARAEQ